MKKIYLLTFSIAINLAYSQVVFCPPGASWNALFTISMWHGAANQNTGIYYTGDTLVGKDTIKILSHNRFYGQCNFYSMRTLILQRGDTIFMNSNKTGNKWEILFNFAATAGQSWNTTYGLIGGTTRTYSITVDSTDYITINNKNLKRLLVHYTYHYVNALYTNTAQIIERMGWGFLFKYKNNSGSCDGDYFIRDLCYSDNNFGTHKYSEFDCYYQNPVGLLERRKEENLTIFPNPASNTLNVEINSEQLRHTTILQIKDAIGRSLKTQAILNQKEIIDIKELPLGLYFLQITEGGSVISQTKFVKQ